MRVMRVHAASGPAIRFKLISGSKSNTVGQLLAPRPVFGHVGRRRRLVRTPNKHAARDPSCVRASVRVSIEIICPPRACIRCPCGHRSPRTAFGWRARTDIINSLSDTSTTTTSTAAAAPAPASRYSCPPEFDVVVCCRWMRACVLAYRSAQVACLCITHTNTHTHVSVQCIHAHAFGPRVVPLRCDGLATARRKRTAFCQRTRTYGSINLRV